MVAMLFVTTSTIIKFPVCARGHVQGPTGGLPEIFGKIKAMQLLSYTNLKVKVCRPKFRV